MKNLSPYDSMSESEKKLYFTDLYEFSQMTLKEISKEIGHSIQWVVKEMERLGIKKRTRSEALKICMNNGKHSHPTKGLKHSEETKQKIGQGRAETWNNISKEDMDAFVQKRKEAWARMTPEEIADLQTAAHTALKISAKQGSRLEKIIEQALLDAGYVVEYHRKALVTNQELEMDLFLPKMNLIIEIDGPTHFVPIFGPERLAKTQAKDAEKNGLLLRAGYIVIRLQQYKKKNITKISAQRIIDKVLKELKRLEENPPVKQEDKLILINED